MRVLFRTDASLRIGTGHVMRCLTLAGSLRERGAEVTFACRDLEGNLIGALRAGLGGQPGYPVHALPRAGGGVEADPSGPPHAGWLETGWRDDAEATVGALRALPGGCADWVVVDHYGLDARWERALRPAASRILAIDDLADRQHACDLLLDQNLYDGASARYAGRLPERAGLRLGPAYAQLRPEFARARATALPRSGSVGRVLVFFGGADALNATSLALSALSRPEFSGIRADVVIGATNPHRAEVEQACAARPGSVLHVQTGDMAGLMSRADLALGAGGTTTWERCCLGLPALVASVADNQRELTAAGHRHGILRDLGWGADLTADAIAESLRWAAAHPDRLAAQSRLGMSLVDGSGAERMADLLLRGSVSAPSMALREAVASDLLAYFEWANEPEARKHSYRSDPIALESHARWFMARLADPDSRMYVLESDGEAAGQIRFQAEGGIAWIAFSVDPRFRGRGLGERLLSLGAARLRADRPGWGIRGAVKLTNPASLKVFAKAGYRRLDDQILHGEPSSIFQFPTEAP